jgi:chromodomain-helicase-DNA-binding protein 4
MTSKDHTLDSEDSEVDMVQTPERKPPPRETSAPLSVLSHRFRESPQKPSECTKGRAPAEDSIAVMVPVPARPWEYQPFSGDTTVDSVLEEIEGPDGGVWYRIDYETGKKEDVSLQLPSSVAVLPVFLRQRSLAWII